MLCSFLHTSAIEQIAVIEQEMLDWMKEHGYESVSEMHAPGVPNSPYRAVFQHSRCVLALQSCPLTAQR